MNQKQMVAEIKRLIRLVGSQKQAARELGISPQYLNDIIGYRREVSDNVAFRMGYERRVRFVRLPKRSATPSPTSEER